MKLAIAKLQLKWKLAEAAKHSITRQRLSVASMSQKVRLHKCLGGLVGEGEVLLRSSDEGFESGRMSEMKMFFACWWLASRIAATNAEQNEELKPSDSNTIRSVNRYDPQVLPENPHLGFSLRLGFLVAERRKSDKAKIDVLAGSLQVQRGRVNKSGPIVRRTSFAGSLELVHRGLRDSGNA